MAALAILGLVVSLGVAVEVVSPVPAGASGNDYVDAVTGDSPLAYWRLEETSGTSFANSVSGGHGMSQSGGAITLAQPGAILNNPIATNPATSYSQDYASSDRAMALSVHNSPSYWASAATAELWFKPDGTSTAGALFVVASACGSGNDVVRLGVDSSGHFTAYVSMASSPFSEVTETVTSPVVSSAGKWHYVAVSAGSGAVTLFVDGIEVTRVASSKPDLHDCGGLGSQLNMSIGDNTATAPGLIDEVAYYGRRLGYGEVQDHYRSSGRMVPLAASAKLGAPNRLMPCVNCMLAEMGLADPVDASTGNFSHGFADLAVPGRGIPLSFTHTYNSALAGVDGLLGHGWAFNWDLHLDINDDLITVVQEGGATATFSADGSGGWAPDAYVKGALSYDSGTSTWTLLRDKLETLVFDTAGRLMSITDLNGEATTLAYPSVTAPVIGDIEVTDATGRVMSIITSTVGTTEVTVVTDPAGRSVSFTKNAAGDLASFTDIRGQSWALGYSSHLLTTMTDPNGGVTTNAYDSDARVTDQWSPVQTALGGSGTPTHFDYSVADKTTITDPEGNATVQSYTDGFLTSQTVAYGTADVATTTYTYDPGSGGPATVTDPSGRVTTATWTAAGRLATLDNGVDPATTFTYESVSGLPLTATDGEGVTTTYTYDGHVNLASVSTPLDGSHTRVTSYTHGDGSHPGDVTTVTDPRGKDWTYTYDTYGNQVSATDPEGNETTTGYDLVGTVLWSVTPRGNAGTPADHRSVVVSDDRGLVVATADAAAKATGDGFGLADGSLGSTETGPSWTAASGTFAIEARRAKLTTAAGGSAANLATVDAGSADQTVGANLFGTAQDDTGIAARVGDATHFFKLVARPGSNTWELLLKNGSGAASSKGTTGSGTCCVPGQRIELRTIGTGLKVYIDGQLKLSTTSSALTTNTLSGLYAATTGTARFDDFATGLAAGAITTAGYDPLGNQTWTLDPSGARTATSFDADAMPSVVTQADGSTKTFGFDRNHQRTSYTDGLSNVTTWSYDHQGRLAATQAPGKSATTIAYAYGTYPEPTWPTRTGDSVTITKPDSTTIVERFDAAGRLEKIDYSDATPDVGPITYDHVGRRTAMTSSVSASTWTWDHLGRLTSSHRGSETVGYDYDLAGNITTLTYPGSRDVTYGYDDAGRMTSLDDWVNSPFTFGWDADSNPTSTVAPNGVTTSRTFDTDSRPTQISVDDTVAPANLATFAQVFDARSQITQIVPTNQTGASTTNCSYDPNARLSGCGGGTFDAAGNPVTLDNKTWSHDASGELCWFVGGTSSNACGSPPAGAVGFAYDANGNRTSRTPAVGFNGNPAYANHYTYDATDRLTSAKLNTTVLSTYSYDGDGLRLAKTVGMLGWDFTWDEHGSLPMLLVDETDAYVYGPSGEALEKVTAGGTPTFIHQDHLGSTRFTTNSTRTKADSQNNSAYGRGGNTTSGNTSLEYAGEYNDYELGMIYLRAREYDPETATFLTADPAFDSTLDRYGYAGGDPLNRVDPSGLAPWDGICIRGVNCPVETQSLGESWGQSYREDHPEAAQGIVDFSSGVLDFNPITAVTNAVGWTDTNQKANTCSWWYHGGQAAMFATDLAMGGSALKDLFSKKGLNLAGDDFLRAAVHDDPHPFRFFGNKPHFQLNWWTAGVKGSGGVFRVPLPWALFVGFP